MAVAVLGLALPALAETCPGCSNVADKGEGWCCGKGMAYGVKIPNRALYDTVIGKEVKADQIKCPGCKTAAESDGVCTHCNVGVANGKAFPSMVAYRLAKGKPLTADQAGHCAKCKVAWEGNGRCETCNAGFVGQRVYKDQQDYEEALAAHKTLTKAAKVATKCPGCALGMVTDGTCKACKVSFKDGKADR